MELDDLKALLQQTVDRLDKPRDYDGMEGDYQLVSSAIIEQDLGQNMEIIPNEDISEGVPEDALERLLDVAGSIENIAIGIHTRWGHSDGHQKRLDIGGATGQTR